MLKRKGRFMKLKKRGALPPCGRFWVWVEYKHSSGDLDAWIHHAARAYSNGGGTMLDDDLRDLSFDLTTRVAAVAMAKRIAAVMKLARGDGNWRVFAQTDDVTGETVKLWTAGEIAKTKTRRAALRRIARKS